MSDATPQSVPLGFLIDTNVLLDIATDDPIWAEWSAGALAHGIRTGPVYINPLIYAEASVGFGDIDEIDERMPAHILRRAPLPYVAGFSRQKPTRHIAVAAVPVPRPSPISTSEPTRSSKT